MLNIKRMLSPKSIAIIGASPDKEKIRGRILSALISGGFAGQVFPVNPAHKTIQGISAYPSLQSISDPVDLALIAIPATSVPNALVECGKKGVKSAIIYSAGFAESGNQARMLQQKISKIADNQKIAVCGPNSVGCLNTYGNVNTSFSPGARTYELSSSSSNIRKRNVAVVSQSGGLGFAIYNRGVVRGIPFSYIISTGNEANVSMLDFVEYLLDQDEVAVIIIIAEQFRDAGRLLKVANKAISKKKPLIVAKLGRSKAAKRGALSHTGSMTGSERAYDAVFKHAGIIRADDQDELLDIAAAFVSCPLVKGSNVGIVTISGGVGVWLADICEKYNLRVPELKKDLQDKLRYFIPDYGGASNPVDITAQALEQGGNLSAIKLLYNCNEINYIIVVAPMTETKMLADEKAELLAITARRTKPLVYYSYAVPNAETLSILSDLDIPCYTSLKGCVRSLKLLGDYANYLKSFIEGSQERKELRERYPDIISMPREKNVLVEWSAAPFLLKLGIPMPASRLVQSEKEAVRAAYGLKGQVALKAQSTELPHKSILNGVILSLSGEKDIRKAYNQIARLKDQVTLQGVLVQKMAPSGIEMVLGIVQDEVFGPLMMVGFGGDSLEEKEDVVWSPVPINKMRALDLINSLRRTSRLLNNVNRKQFDFDALAHAMTVLSLFADKNRDTIVELDLNPVLLFEKGKGLMALDALIVTNIN